MRNPPIIHNVGDVIASHIHIQEVVYEGVLGVVENVLLFFLLATTPPHSLSLSLSIVIAPLFRLWTRNPPIIHSVGDSNSISYT